MSPTHQSRTLLILFLSLQTIQSQNLAGDDLIGAIFPIYSPSEVDPKRCFPKMNFRGLLMAEEFIFSVNKVNEDKTVLVNSTLGFALRDHCNSESIALKVTSSFFDADKDQQKSAVIGQGDFKQVLIKALAGILSAKDPPIPYLSPTPLQSNNESRGSNLFEVTPSRSRLMEGLHVIMKHFLWDYVVVVSMDNEDGILKLKHFQESLSDKYISISRSYQMTSSDDYEKRVQEIKSFISNKTIDVIVLLTPEDVSFNLTMQAAKQSLDVLWLVTEESWDMNRDILRRQMGGLIYIGLAPPSTRKEFKKYLKDTDLQQHRALNPWYTAEYKNGLLAIADKHNGIISDAVYAIAHALQMRYNDTECAAKSIGEYLKSVDFKAPSGRQFSITEDGILKYTEHAIYNLKMVGSKALYKEIGFVSYSKDEGEKLQIKVPSKDIRWGSNIDGGVPKSRCSTPCQPGWYAVQDPRTPVKSCFNCRKCPEGQESTYNARSCTPKSTIDIPPWKKLQALITYGVVGALLIVIMFVIIIFCRLPTAYNIRYCSNATVHLLCSLILTALLPVALFLPVEPIYCNVYNGAYTLCLGIPIAILISQSKFFKDRVHERKSEEGNRGCVCDPQPAIYTILLFSNLVVAGIFIFYFPSEILQTKISGTLYDECSSHSDNLFLILFFYVIFLGSVLFLVSIKSLKRDMGEYDTASVCYCVLAFFILCFLYFFSRNYFEGSNKIISLAIINFFHVVNFLFLIYIPKLCMIHVHDLGNRPKISFLSPYELSQAQEKVSERLSNTLPRDNLSPLLPQRVMVHDESVKQNGETTRF